jgi:hypothetical protein
MSGRTAGNREGSLARPDKAATAASAQRFRAANAAVLTEAGAVGDRS